MSNRPITAVSPDPSIGDALVAALASVSTAVKKCWSIDELGDHAGDAALYVVHAVDPAAIVAQLPGDAPVIVVWPGSELAAHVELMQRAERVVAVLSAEDLQRDALAGLAMRILADDLFGLEQLIGTSVETREVATYRDKTRCLAAIGALADAARVPSTLRASIEQCVDEMLMNALYDAPVGESGAPLFGGVPTRTRIAERTEHAVVAQYACDGKQLAVAVRDVFGSLTREAVLRHVHKGLHVADPIDRKASGAGMGLYLMLNAASAVYFHVLPRIATEVICVFDLASAQPQLAQLGFVVQHDPRGRVPVGPAHRSAAPLAPAQLAIRIAVPVLALAAVAIGIAVWPHSVKPAQLTVTTVPAGATVELDGRAIGIAAEGTVWIGDLASGSHHRLVARLDGYAVAETAIDLHAGDNSQRLELAALPRVELETQPTGAVVELGGKRVGTTPVTLTQLAPGTTVALAFQRRGFRAASASLVVPRPGDTKRLVQPLEASDELVRVRFVSDPPGAAIVATGTQPGPDRIYTPAEVYVSPGSEQRFTLVMPKHAPLVIPPFTVERGQEGVEKGGTLAPP